MRLLITALVLAMLAGCNSSEIARLEDENAALEDQVATLEEEKQDLRNALEEANQSIQQAASDISDAQGSMYNECEDLRYAVSAMSEPQEVYEP